MADFSSKFRTELQSLINRHSRENGSNTPDFTLACFLLRCLEAFDEATNERDRWYGLKPVPGQSPYITNPEGQTQEPKEGGERKHFAIISRYGGQMGCTWGEDGKESVLIEEPDATFRECPQESCPVCNEDKPEGHDPTGQRECEECGGSGRVEVEVWGGREYVLCPNPNCPSKPQEPREGKQNVASPTSQVCIDRCEVDIHADRKPTQEEGE